jgi:Fe2+ or Zn2+ uptake regulation protein
VDVHEAAAERLHGLGQRYTPGRRGLVDILIGLSGPVTIDAIRDTPDGALPLSSVYRNLALLEEAGVVRRVPGADDSTRYELAEDLTEHHHHLVCTNCNKVEDFVVPKALERALAKAAAALDFEATGHSLDLVGLCADCRWR